MTDTTHPLWAVAADTICEGWSPGTTTEDGKDYADVYLTRTEAEKELADLTRERLTCFIEDPESYDGLSDALNSGFEIIEVSMRDDGTVLIDGEAHGEAPPSIRSALASTSSKPPQPKAQ